MAALLAGASGLLARPAFAANQTVAFVPKFTSDPYFVSANQGAQEAGKELGLTVQYNGPVDANVAGQVDIVDRLVSVAASMRSRSARSTRPRSHRR